jgi:hypothetical protein
MQEINKLTISTGFITPENIQIEVPITEMGNFCKKYCLEYASKNEENGKRFNDFAKNYTYFKPYLEFLTSELGWIQVGTTLNPKMLYCNYGKRNPIMYNKNRLEKSEEESLYNYILNRIKKDCYHIEPLNSCCDTSLNIKHDMCCIDSCVYVMNDGVFIDAGMSHEITSTSILQTMLLECSELLEDYINEKKHAVSAENYLIQKLGVLKINYYKPIVLYYVNNLMSEKQKNVIYHFISKEHEISEETCMCDLEETKKLIREYNSSRY